MSLSACENCKFGLPLKGYGILVCRRYPPVPVATVGECFDPGDTLAGFWPRVDPDDICGEYQQCTGDEQRRF